MSDWYMFSIVALIFMGTQRFLYKVSAERKCPTAWTTFSFMTTVAALSVAVFFLRGESISNAKMLWLTAALNSGSFLVGTMTHIEALKHIPASVVYPVIRLNMVIVVIFSLFYFHDRLSVYQGMGIALAIAVILILTRDLDDKKKGYGNVRKGLILVAISVVSGSVASISSKLAALYANKVAFMALSYFMGACFSLGLASRLNRSDEKGHHKEALTIGFLMGLINFVGFYAFLKALSAGPLSIIISIVGMHFVIAVILSALIYKERMAFLRVLGTLLAVVSILLLRMGPVH
jgi:drug/metabolite transporter (DMT)-like permease